MFGEFLSSGCCGRGAWEAVRILHVPSEGKLVITDGSGRSWSVLTPGIALVCRWGILSWFCHKPLWQSVALVPLAKRLHSRGRAGGSPCLKRMWWLLAIMVSPAGWCSHQVSRRDRGFPGDPNHLCSFPAAPRCLCAVQDGGNKEASV